MTVSYTAITVAELAALSQFKRTQPALKQQSNLQADIDFDTLLGNMSTAIANFALGERILAKGQVTALSAGTTKFTDPAFTLSGQTHFYPSSVSASEMALTRCDRADNALSGAVMTVTLEAAANVGTGIFNYIHIE